MLVLSVALAVLAGWCAIEDVRRPLPELELRPDPFIPGGSR